MKTTATPMRVDVEIAAERQPGGSVRLATERSYEMQAGKRYSLDWRT